MTIAKRLFLIIAGITALGVLKKSWGRPFSWWLSFPAMLRNWTRHFGRIAYKSFGLDDQGLAAWSKSEYGEDVALLPLLLGFNGYAVEVGANDGLANSNTYLYERLGWTGLLVEPDPDKAKACQNNRRAFTTVHAACVAPGSPDFVAFNVVKESQLSFATADTAHLIASQDRFGRNNIKTITVPARTLDTILKNACAPSPIDFISIDVEGMEFDVLSGFTISNWRPKVVILERSGMSFDSRITNYMGEHGYKYVRTTPVNGQPGNDWYVRDVR